jgi:polyhydroxyalkanoate synthesis regulator phasin
MTTIRDEIMDVWCQLKALLDKLEPIADTVQELELDYDGYRATQQIWHDKRMNRIDELEKQVKALEAKVRRLEKENSELLEDRDCPCCKSTY